MGYGIIYTIQQDIGALNKGGCLIVKEIEIKITLTDDNITLDGQNLQELTEDDIVDSIKVLVTLAKTLSILSEGDPTNGNA